MSKPRLLYLSPVKPGQAGSGLVTRTASVAEALRRNFDVVTAAPHARGFVRRNIRDRFPSLYPLLYSTPGDWLAGDWDGGDGFDRVHLYKHWMAPFAARYIGRGVPCQLDLDESEARTRARLGALQRANGNLAQARILEWEAEFYTRSEREWLPRFERIFVSSEPERRYLEGLGLASRIVPNVAPIRGAVQPPPEGGPLTLLFVGNLYYYPNRDAVQFLAGQIVPILRSRAGQPFRLRIVGSAPPGFQASVPAAPEVEWLGFVPDLTAVYRDAHIAVAPVRAGGGTRIKILEAFAHGRPVVSTTAGAEGIEAGRGREILLADDADAFATECLRLANDKALRDRLAGAARAFVLTRHSQAAVEAALL